MPRALLPSRPWVPARWQVESFGGKLQIARALKVYDQCQDAGLCQLEVRFSNIFGSDGASHYDPPLPFGLTMALLKLTGGT